MVITVVLLPSSHEPGHQSHWPILSQVRQGLKKFSNWPTYPQLYVNGELIGGLDIVKVRGLDIVKVRGLDIVKVRGLDIVKVREL